MLQIWLFLITPTGLTENLAHLQGFKYVAKNRGSNKYVVTFNYSN